MARMSLGSEIARLRIEKGLLQKDLAAQVGVSQSHMARWERDQMRPRKRMVQQLADALEVPVDTLLAAEENESLLLQQKDPSLAELLRQVHKLEQPELDALRTVLESMLVKARVQEAIHPRKPARKSPEPVETEPTRRLRARQGRRTAAT